MAVRKHFSLQVTDFFRVLIKETIRRLQIMVQVIDLFSVLIKETIMRLQVIDPFRVPIKERVEKIIFLSTLAFLGYKFGGKSA